MRRGPLQYKLHSAPIASLILVAGAAGAGPGKAAGVERAAKRSAGIMDTTSKAKDRKNWLEAELADTIDEDYELELSEPALSMELRKIYKEHHAATMDRPAYFRELLTLQ